MGYGSRSRGRHGRSGWSEKSRKAGKRWGKCWRALTSSSLVRGELHLQPGRSAYVMHVSLDALLVHALDAFTPQHLPSLRRVLPLLVKHHGAGEVGSAGGVLIAVEVEARAGDVRCGREDTRVYLNGAGSRVVRASRATIERASSRRSRAHGGSRLAHVGPPFPGYFSNSTTFESSGRCECRSARVRTCGVKTSTKGPP